jgi:putative ABC transport system permease protein
MPAAASGVEHRMVAGTTDLGADGVLIDEDLSKSNGWKVGTVVQAAFPDGARQPLHVVGVYPTGSLGSVILPRDLYLAHTGVQSVNAVYVKVRSGDPAIRTALQQALADYPDLEISDRAEFTKEKVAGLGQMLALITMLLALSIVIAAVGVVNTLALSVFERTREIGLLRAVGTGRRQVHRMIRLESVLITAFGAVLGVGLGVGFGVALQHAFAEQGFGVLVVPATPLGLCAALAVSIGVVAAVWPARRAARMDVLAAIETH